MKYDHYEIEDFVGDDYFQSWVLDSDSMTDNFWKSWMDINPDKVDIIKTASQLVRLLNNDYRELPPEDFDDMWQNIVQKKAQLKGSSIFSRVKFSYILKIAVVFVGGMITALTIYQMAQNKVMENPSMVLEPEITLELEDGTIKVLDKEASKIITNAKGEAVVTQNQNALLYNQENKTISNDLVYNTLSVPYGKKFELVFSDGSHVFLNSGSKLRYPVTFLKDKPRHVFLDGEAYFFVEKDKKRPFTVFTDDMNTRVYGTKFNVSSYKNENNTSTVLVEGNVSVYKSNTEKEQKSIRIKPGQRATFEDNNIAVDKVNVNKHIAWIDGKLFFVDHLFGLIVKELERHFNVIIDNKFLELNDNKYTGTFQKESLSEILKIIQEHTSFNFYIEGKIVTIERDN